MKRSTKIFGTAAVAAVAAVLSSCAATGIPGGGLVSSAGASACKTNPNGVACKTFKSAAAAKARIGGGLNNAAEQAGAAIGGLDKKKTKGDEGVRAAQTALRDDANCLGANGKPLTTDGVKSNADGSQSNTEYAFESFQAAASEAGHNGVDFTAQAIKFVAAAGVKCAPR